jgi:peptidoglycan/xylan/chitin deacetylase (PgdA/CDA1 family)
MTLRIMTLAALAATAIIVAAFPRSSSLAQGTAAASCGPSALGVSRVIEIETAGGPRFGHQQYREIDNLQDGEIVLTFDDGPLRPYTQPVLAALAAHCTKATFFMVGKMAVADPEMAREVARRGHTIATHTWSHQNVRAMLPQRAKMEIELGFSAVQRVIGQPIAPFFRFPFLADSRAMTAHLQSRDIGIFSIDADAYDYKTQDGNDVHRAIMSQLAAKRKGIVLFHDIQPSTARALKGLLDDLRTKGYRVVHLVPKGRATTLAEFDAMAAKEIGDKRLAAASQPLANRSVVWPVSPGRATAPVAAPTAPPVVFAPPPPAQAVEPPSQRRTRSEPDWRDTIFSR